MSERWQDDDTRQRRQFASVSDSILGRVAIAGMALSAVYQLLSTVVLTLATLVMVGAVTVVFVQYDGGLSSNEQEAAAGVLTGLVIFLCSLMPLISALCAGICSIQLWRGGSSVPVYVAAVLSMGGPMVILAAVSLSAMASALVGAVASLVGVVATLGCMTTAAFAIVAVSNTTVGSAR